LPKNLHMGKKRGETHGKRGPKRMDDNWGARERDDMRKGQQRNEDQKNARGKSHLSIKD